MPHRHIDMKNPALLLLICASMAACSPEPEKNNTTSPTELANSQPGPVAPSDTASDADSSAVARQPHVEPSVTKIRSTTPTSTVSGKGAQLIAASDCASCHRENEKLVGPAYTAVAAKYPNTDANVAMLAGRVISGGTGNWGEIAMIPHPGLSEGDAKEMARYILSLK